ncbi:MAG TPA: adenylate/guanylate cyclase domain-containing protein, partial [Cyclobacteriaceae bacterium]
RDEKKGLEILRQNREIQRPLIEEHNGRWLKEMGDGVLAKFNSAYDSVICALKIQRKAMMGFDAKIRIGIHLGDITVDSDDVFGDGVNIASRLENVADPGGIYISESIQRALRGRNEIKVQHLGELQLKNVDYLVSTYCLVDDGLPVPSAAKIRQLRAASISDSGAPLSNINHQIINQVFEALAAARPSVRKYIEMMEEEDEEPDVRELADLIIRNYPWVVGVELRRLFSGSLRSLDDERLEQLLISIHRTLQFLGIVLIIELYERVVEGKVYLQKEFVQELKSRFVELSTSDYVWIIKEIGKCLDEAGVPRFIPEIAEKLDAEFYEALDFPMPVRNSSGEYDITQTDDEIAKTCFEYQEKLTFILKKLAFLTPYKLVTIKEIKVLKGRHKQALFEHWMDILSSTNSDFRSKEEKFDSFSDSNAVLFMKSLKRPDNFLNLSPFIIDTRGESLDSKEKFNLKKDIFICEGFANNNIRYVGTEIAEECDLKGLSNYNDLVEEFRTIIKMEKIDDEDSRKS